MNRSRRILAATVAALALTASLALAADPAPATEPGGDTRSHGGHSGHVRMAPMLGLEGAGHGSMHADSMHADSMHTGSMSHMGHMGVAGPAR